MRVTAVLLFILSISSTAFGQAPVLWDEQFDASGGLDIARAIAVTGKTVVVTGGTTTTDGNTEMAVRSYNKKTGKVRWQDSTPLINGVQTAVYATKVANVVYTAGYTPNGVGSDIDVRAFNATTGAPLWQNVMDRGRDDMPRDLAANQSAVVVAGYGGNTAGGNLDLVVRAYDRTGRVLWDDQVDVNGQSDTAFRVALTETQAIVGGSTLEVTPTRTITTLILRAYDLTTGALSWDVRETDFSPTTLTVRGGRVFVGGSSVTLGTTRAYKATTGKLLWEDGGSSGQAVRDIQVRAGQLVEVGAFGVRLMDVKTGHAAWESPSPASEFLSMVELGPNAIYVAGSNGNEFVSESVVRAYDYNGNVIWEDRAYRSSNTQPHALTLSGRKLFVAGHVTRADGRNVDFFIRTYDVTSLEPDQED